MQRWRGRSELAWLGKAAGYKGVQGWFCSCMYCRPWTTGVVLPTAVEQAYKEHRQPLPGWLMQSRQAPMALASAHPSSIPSLNNAFDTFLALYLLHA